VDRVRICCITHVPFEGPGTIADWAADRGHPLEVVDATTGKLPFPIEFDMFVSMGGPMSASDPAHNPWLLGELELLAAAVEGQRLVLGVCLGSQVLASAMGGLVHPGAEPEIGWFPVRMTEAGRASKVFGGWPEQFVAGHWHGDTFDLPEGTVSAASSEVTANQAFEMAGGRVVGLQFHLEWTRHSLATLVSNCADELVGEGPWKWNAKRLLEDEGAYESSRELLFGLLDRMEELA
jgi:GMP synthase-like glutamine amidotransferase